MRVRFLGLVLVAAAGCGAPPPPVGREEAATADTDAEYSGFRRAMVERQILGRAISDPGVLAAMGNVPRHEFVHPGDAHQAYRDSPLAIGYGQTISQPYMVASMTEEIRLEPGARVLEIGTGSGYQAAVLAEITDNVFTVEIIEELAETAAARLRRLGYDKVKTLHGDGWHGWKEHAPYDAIVVTAAPRQIPPALVRQLAPGGRLIIPVGRAYTVQTLVLVRKDEEGEVTTRNLYAVRFVPFTRAKDAAAGPK